MTQFTDQFKISSASKLIKEILRVLQKWHRCFNGTITSTFTLPAILPLTVIVVLKLNESVALAPLKLTISPSSFTADISLQYSHTFPDVF